MEELRSEDLEELVQELEEEHGAQESLPQEVEELLHILQSGEPYLARWNAAEQLGKVDTSSPRIVQALIAARQSDTHRVVRDAASTALRASVHQAVLQEHPDLMKRAESAAEQAATQREKQREKQTAMKTRQDRKKPMSSLAIVGMIAFGIVWVGAIIASGLAVIPLCFGLAALPGVAVVALGLWFWLSPTSPRNVLRRSCEETAGRVVYLDKVESRGDYGPRYKYFVTVLFEADHAKLGTRLIALKAQVNQRIWKGMQCDNTVGIRYAPEDPRVALIEGEW